LNGAAAAAGVAALGSGAQEAAPGPAAPAPTAPNAAPPPLPPPIARSSYVTRMEQARALMRETKATALIETPGTHLRYLTGLDLHRSERLIAFVLPVEGDPVLLGPLLERDRLTTSPAGIEEVRTWEENERSFEALEKILRKAGVSDKKVAIGSTTWYDDFVRLQEQTPKMTFVSTTPIVGSLRERKSPEEVACMQAAIDITERAIDAALAETREGIREDELSDLIVSNIEKMGASGGGLVQFGPRSAVPHNPTSDRRLAPGDIVLIDFGAQVQGYWSDISRPAVLGQATGRMKLVHDSIRQAQKLALERAKPDTPCESLDIIARATLGGHGFSKFILHRLGHGIGLDGHEPPWLTLGNADRLAVGHVATLEPGVYTPNDYGIRIEDMMEVTPQGGRMLSRPPERLREI